MNYGSDNKNKAKSLLVRKRINKLGGSDAVTIRNSGGDLESPAPVMAQRYNVISPNNFRSGEAANEVFK